MVVSASSSVQQARQVLADRLGELMRQAGLTGLDIANHCGWNKSKSSRILNARTAPSESDIRAWCRACNAESHQDDLIASLRAVEGMVVEWQRMERAGLRQAQEAGQLGQLISVASMPNVSLGIVPMRPGRTRWPAEGFWIFDSGQVNGAIVKSCGSVPYALRCS
jgi:transcriptional regulator with XRE-family HTH domain